MITPQAARMLTRYNTWANKLIFDAVAGLPGRSHEGAAEPVQEYGPHLNHNYVIDLIWQAHLEGREQASQRATPRHPPLAELWRKQQVVDDWYIAWSDRLSEAALRENVPFTLIAGQGDHDTRRDPAPHRQPHELSPRLVADLFYQVPAPARDHDLPVFLRESAAALA